MTDDTRARAEAAADAWSRWPDAKDRQRIRRMFIAGWMQRDRDVGFLLAENARLSALIAGVRAEAAAAALESLARGEKHLAETIGADIDTRGRTRLLEVARRIRKHGTTAPEGEHTEPTEPTEPKCECWETPESQWFVHYGAVEPGSQMEPNPECPVHFPQEAPDDHRTNRAGD